MFRWPISTGLGRSVGAGQVCFEQLVAPQHPEYAVYAELRSKSG